MSLLADRGGVEWGARRYCLKPGVTHSDICYCSVVRLDDQYSALLNDYDALKRDYAVALDALREWRSTMVNLDRILSRLKDEIAHETEREQLFRTRRDQA